jgi:solute carrier family 25 S-adenosylmethionine transporter 26
VFFILLHQSTSHFLSSYVSPVIASRASAIFVGVYEPLKRKLLGIFPDHLSSVAHLAAGAAGGLTASLVRVPTEVVKQRMQTGQFASAHGAVRQIVGAEGVRGLYAGFGSFLLRDLPFDAIQFCIYEQLRIVCRKLVKRDLVDAETAIIGAASGMDNTLLISSVDGTQQSY